MHGISYGAGAIGGVVGGHLACVGLKVTLIGRPGHVKAMREHGLRLITPTATSVLRLPAVTGHNEIDFGPDDVVFLATGDEVELIARAARREARAILAQAGIRWVSEQELAQEWPEMTVSPRSTLDVQAQSSTWQSLARRQGTVESDFLNGEVVRQARQMGRQAPINETLLRISQEMAINREVPGKHAPAQLWALLGLDQSSYDSKSAAPRR